MIQRSALPAAICHDCGHAATLHAQPCTGDESCPCMRSSEMIERHAHEVMEEQRTERRRLGYAVAVSTVACLLAGGGSYALSVQNVRRMEQRNCASLRADIMAVEGAGRLTKAGAAVVEARRIRYEQIGCTPKLDPPNYVVINTPGN